MRFVFAWPVPARLMAQREKHVLRYAAKYGAADIDEAIRETCRGEKASDTLRRLRGVA